MVWLKINEKGIVNMTIANINQARIDFRTTPEVKSLIEQAAAIYGMTVSEYIKAIVVEKSRQVIEHHETRILSDRDRDLFLSLLDAPAAPNAALLAAAAEFKNVVKDKALIS
jgi:uncharacterized protein (DUF1778 family)